MIANGGLISNYSFQASNFFVSFKPVFAKTNQMGSKKYLYDVSHEDKPHEHILNKFHNPSGHLDTKVKSYLN